ncbi:phosphotransferase enzyme family protein [Turicibacter sp. H121]|uniref:phosphotransferase enzyme family protein n=1 Tax=Turicibacter sp. H121 TaxID=1712675 RepID=UPI00076325AE|nr:phosphotransferase [Turicibacter sp. H121]AMC09234.1 hypothetical protein AT726_10205 [Turicibacter sp. H121]MCU7198816.1 phosphotransferase [Turicibacter sp. H121]
MELNQLKEILACYFLSDCQIHQGASGMNNLTRFIEHEGKKYVLRVYQNHSDENLVQVEQEILKRIKGVPVPVLVPTMRGDYLVRLYDKIAVLFEYQEGVNLKLERLDQYKNYGEMIGKLSRALGKLEVDKEGYSPYYELDEAYPNHQICEFCQHPYEEFESLHEELKVVERVYEDLMNLSERFKTLPQQLIHGDINSSNLLMDEAGMISRILDFEFVTKDLRAMEIAICLSEILSEGQDEVWPRLEAFIEGLKQSLQLTKEETEVLPSLILLRRLDVVMHFIVRYRRNISSEIVGKGEFLSKQIVKLVEQSSWIEENGNRLIELLSNCE